MDYNTSAVRRSFGVFYISVAVGIAMAAFSTEAISYYAPSTPLYAVIWAGIPSGSVAIFRFRHRGMFRLMGKRFRQSISWPVGLKAVTGICWAAPFAVIPLLPDYYSYLVLLGIGLGNTSTYVITRKVNGTSLSEQLIVGMVSLAAVPLMAFLGLSHTISSDMLHFLARLSIAVAYGTGGAHAQFGE